MLVLKNVWFIVMFGRLELQFASKIHRGGRGGVSENKAGWIGCSVADEVQVNGWRENDVNKSEPM